MANQKKRRWRWVFPCFLLLYALIFSGVAYFGLKDFWNYIDAYEQSRSYHAVDAYMEKLTPDYVCEKSEELISQIDHHVQSEASCRQVIKDALSEGFTYFKKSSESTDEKIVYVLRSGKKVIGRFEIGQRGDAVHGFTPWEVISDSFDMSFLLADSISVTVPHNSFVYVNGNLLTQDYITEDNIPYTDIQEFYKDYSLPYMVTYEAGPFLTEATLSIKDTAGQELVLDENTDMNQFVDNCTGEEVQDLQTVVEGFVGSYVDFTSAKNNDSYGNFLKLSQYMVPNGALSSRMYNALDGLFWVSDRGAKVAGIDIHHFVNLGQDRYMCDVTYRVDTRTFSGEVQTTSNVKIIFLKTEDGLKAESMASY